MQEEAFAETGRHQPVGGGQCQHHQNHHDETAYESNYLVWMDKTIFFLLFTLFQQQEIVLKCIRFLANILISENN